MSEDVRVDQDGIRAVGFSYRDQAEQYDHYLTNLERLRDRGPAAWGNDEMGKGFSTTYLQGLNDLEAVIKGVQSTLDYSGEGLHDSAESYEESEDFAVKQALKLEVELDDGSPSGGFFMSVRPNPPLVSAVDEQAPIAETSYVDQNGDPIPTGRKFMTKGVADESTAVHLEPASTTQFFSSERPSDSTGVMVRHLPKAREPESWHSLPKRSQPTEVMKQPLGELAVPVGENVAEPYAVTPQQLTPTMAFEPVASAEPAQGIMRSTSYMDPLFATAHVGGEPVPEGYQLLALNPLSDGTTRIDANMYHSVDPVSPADVTNPDGSPIDTHGRQLLVVGLNTDVDPSAPNYQPMVMSYSTDGSPLGELAVPAGDSSTEPYAVTPQQLTPTMAFEPVASAEPAQGIMRSTSYMDPLFATAHVGGEPVPEGYQLLALNPLSDGTTRIDANMYHSVDPVSPADVTNPDGSPIDTHGQQLLMVRPNPDVDPSAPGYQPAVMSYSTDGSPSLYS